MAEMQPSSDIYGILLNRGTPEVLMLIDKSGNWSLPHAHISDKRIWWAMVRLVNSEMKTILAADVTVLRNVSANYAAEGSHVDLIYTLENHSEDWSLPPQSKWIDRQTLQSLTLSHPEHRPVIEDELREAETGSIPDLRPPWARSGWFKAASTWMRDQLTARNYVLTSATVQDKSWGISCLLRTSTDQGDIYFKIASSRPLLGNEPTLMKAIAEHYPDAVPAPIVIEPEQRWMLMQDFGPELRAAPTLERWEAAIRRFGNLQVQTASEIENLLAIGCRDRRLDILTRQIDPLLNDEAVLALLEADDITRLYDLAPQLKSMCGKLAEYHVPYSLNHGDLHGGNITGGTLLFFDWTDACISHPFLDLCTVMLDLEYTMPDGREPLLEAYLNLWTAYEPMDRLRDMWRLAEPLGALHQAVSYQYILAGLEPASRQDLAEGVPLWLRRVIQTMPD